MLLPAGHTACHAVATLLEDREQIEDFLTESFEAFSHPANMRRNQVFFHGETLENLAAFRTMSQSHADNLLRPGTGDILAVEENLAGGRLCYA